MANVALGTMIYIRYLDYDNVSDKTFCMYIVPRHLPAQAYPHTCGEWQENTIIGLGYKCTQKSELYLNWLEQSQLRYLTLHCHPYTTKHSPSTGEHTVIMHYANKLAKHNPGAFDRVHKTKQHNTLVYLVVRSAHWHSWGQGWLPALPHTKTKSPMLTHPTKLPWGLETVWTFHPRGIVCSSNQKNPHLQDI